MTNKKSIIAQLHAAEILLESAGNSLTEVIMDFEKLGDIHNEALDMADKLREMQKQVKKVLKNA